MKRTISALTFSALMLGAAGADADDVVVGAGFVLSGPIAAYGEDAKTGVDLGVEHINANGGVLGRELRVDYEDTGADRAKAVAIYQKFAAQPEVVAMMSISSIEFVALDPVASEANLPLLSVGSAAPIDEFSDWSFRIQLIVSKAMGPVLTRLKEERGIGTVAVIYDTANNYNVGEMESVKSAAADVGLEFLGVETFSTGDQNFSLQLTSIAQQNPNLLYVAATTNEAALIINQARSLGIEADILGGAGLNDPRVTQLPGGASEGIMTFFPFDATDPRPVVQEFVELYKAKYDGETPPAYVALGFDAISLIADAVERAGSTDREAVRDALASIDGYEGVNGAFRYDGSGDNLEQRPHIFVFKDGEFRRMD